MAKPSDQEILARIDNEVTSALGYGDELSEQRRKALEYYLGHQVGGREGLDFGHPIRLS